MADHLISVNDVCIACGIYFLCSLDRVVYVGQSICTGARIARHKQEGRSFDRAYILPAPREDLNKLEASFIRALNPPGNKVQPVQCADPKILMEFGWIDDNGGAA